MEDIITNFDKFDPDQIDYDEINFERIYYNLYNNKLNRSLQNFYFIINNIKYKNEFKDYKIITFALNHKCNLIKKLINFLNEMIIYLKSKFEKIYPDVIIEIPWKEYNNYPYLLKLFNTDDIIFVDSEKNIKCLSEINHKSYYSILFEITYIKMIKLNDKNIMKFKFSLLKIEEEQDVNLKLFSIINYNFKENICLNKYTNNIGDINSNNNSAINNSISKNSISKNSISNNSANNTNINSNNKLINFAELLETKNKLKKVSIELNKNFNNIELNETYLNKKNDLKKVKTREKSLFKKIKKKKNHRVDIENIEKEFDLLLK